MQTENTENLSEDKDMVDNEISNGDFVGEVPELTIEEKLQLEVGEMKDKYIRMYSEFENFRRRTAKEKNEMRLSASQDLLKELLPVVDDFERAQLSIDNAVELQPVKDGVDLIFNKLTNILNRQGVTNMDAKGEAFDSELHECITQIEAGEENKGKVVDVIEKGYTLNGKVIRYAKVVVGK